jgi:hypothetical protein
MRLPRLLSLLLPLALALAACTSPTEDLHDAQPADAHPADAAPAPASCRNTMTWCEDGKIYEGTLRDDSCTGIDTCVSTDTVHFSDVQESARLSCTNGCAPAGEASACRFCASADGGIPFCGDHLEELCAPAP